MKKLLLLCMPMLLVGCEMDMAESTTETESATAQFDVSSQTVYQWTSVQPATQGLSTMEKTSDEYWQTVSGKQLKEGVEVFLTTDNNLIRVAPKARYENGEVFQAQGIELESLSLLSSNQKVMLNMQPKANQQQMKLAGFDDGSVALKALTNGKNAILKSKQALDDDANYLIHVKEKGSDIQLFAKNSFVKSQHSDALSFDLNLAGQPVAAANVNLTLHSPADEQVAVSYSGSKVHFAQPLEQLGAINGFYEVEALVEMEINGKAVKRSVKVPFTNSAETAVLGKAQYLKHDNEVLVAVPVDADMPGRFALKATLATRENGEILRLATVEVAKDIDASGTLVLPFKVNGVSQKEVFVTDLELTDQSRMLKTYPTF